MVSVSVETPEQTEARLCGVIAQAWIVRWAEWG